jgi:hypothetical protein
VRLDPVAAAVGERPHQDARLWLIEPPALFIDGASAPAADPFMVVSPPRPGLLSRLRGLLRRGQ